VRPGRVRKLVNLEGFGLPATRPEQAPARYAKWLDELRVKPRMRPYGSKQEVASRLQKTNPHLTSERAEFLAGEWARPNSDGEWEILGDPKHKQTSPLLYRLEEVLACWQAITAPVLWVEAEDTDALRWMGPKDAAREEIDRRMKAIPKITREVIGDASHMLHHDQPEALAVLIEGFLS
jgi:pimeloyl-ACP methyl ester carboxylesterase